MLALVKFSGSYKWALAGIVLLGILGSLSEGIGLGLMIPFLDLVLSADSGGKSGGMFVKLLRMYGIDMDPGSRLLLIGSTMVGMVLLKSTITFVNVKLMAWVNGTVVNKIRRQLFDQLLDVAYDQFTRYDPGRLQMLADMEVRRIGRPSACLTT